LDLYSEVTAVLRFVRRILSASEHLSVSAYATLAKCRISCHHKVLNYRLRRKKKRWRWVWQVTSRMY